MVELRYRKNKEKYTRSFFTALDAVRYGVEVIKGGGYVSMLLNEEGRIIWQARGISPTMEQAAFLRFARTLKRSIQSNGSYGRK